MSGVVEDIVEIPGKIVGGLVKPFTPQVPGVPQAPGVPDAPKDPTSDQSEIKAAVDQQRKRMRAARGRQSTILTSGSTLGEPQTRRKTILGS